MSHSGEGARRRAFMLVLATLLCGGAATAQAPEAQESHEVQESKRQVQTSQAKVQRPPRRILHLRSGGVVRGRAQLVGDTWEIQRKGKPSGIPAKLVERATLEKEVLSQARSLERKVASDDLVGRVAYADWCLREGLYEEALDQLDRVLGKNPNHPEAIALLERNAPPLALPRLPEPTSTDAKRNAELFDAFVRPACNARSSGREIAVVLLGEVKDAAGMYDAIRGDLGSKSVRRREFATLALRRLYPGQEIKPLVMRSILDPSENVRRGASHALKEANEPAVVIPALRALGSSHPVVRTNAAEALGNMGYAHAVEPLYNRLVSTQLTSSGRVPHSYIYVGKHMAYIQDFDVEVAQFEAVADPVINVLVEGTVLDTGVLAVSSSVVATERATLRRSLSRLTGASPGHTTAAWKAWWNEHGDEWKMGDGPSGPPSSPQSPDR
ncbi:MAG: HEAT repeat domain-containing protein [Planctomycetota bacterium]|nr:HEAT repeat domain-containing protein [Planctomycetota bacterium]